jgi:hypothetical protein
LNIQEGSWFLSTSFFWCARQGALLGCDPEMGSLPQARSGADRSNWSVSRLLLILLQALWKPHDRSKARTRDSNRLPNENVHFGHPVVFDKAAGIQNRRANPASSFTIDASPSEKRTDAETADLTARFHIHITVDLEWICGWISQWRGRL